jgi:hypothetical protein
MRAQSTTSERLRALCVLAEITGDASEPVQVGVWGERSGLPARTFANAAIDLATSGAVRLTYQPGTPTLVSLP